MKLPAKLKNLFKGKKSSDEDDDDLDDENDSEDDADDDNEDGDDDDGDDDYDDDDDDGEASGGFVARLKSDKRLMIMVGGGAMLALVGLGGAAWFFIGSDAKPAHVAQGAQGAQGAAGKSASIKEITSGLKVVQKMPAKGRRKRPAMLTPPASANGDAHAPATASAPAFKSGSLNAVGTAVKGPGKSVVVASVTRRSFKNIAGAQAEKPLSIVPDKGLVESTMKGPLPKIASDGRKPWQIYARPFKAPDNHPRIAIIITGMGLNGAATEAAIKQLPGAITLLFNPYVKDLKGWANMARKAGHETLLSLPMGSEKFPIHDPGPLAMLSTLKSKENLARLTTVLGKQVGYVGVATKMGSEFLINDKALRPVLEAINARGLMLLDNGYEAKSQAFKIAGEISLPRAINNLLLDENPSRAAIDSQLIKLEGIAREKSVAVAIAEPNPSTIERLAVWAASLKAKNLVLAPISAIADKQTVK